MKRFENWPELLAQGIATRLNQPFEWGRNDCILFACGLICDITGEDTAKDFQLRYETARGAAKAVRAAGHGTLDGLVCEMAALAGMRQIPVPAASRGDMVSLYRGGSAPMFAFAYGIVGTCGSVIFPGRKAPLQLGLKAWKVG